MVSNCGNGCNTNGELSINTAPASTVIISAESIYRRVLDLFKEMREAYIGMVIVIKSSVRRFGVGRKEAQSNA